jgi:nucleotide-binding universal stress UspA family protein
MLPFRKILFPVDYSSPCQAVVPYVKEMARRFSADLALVHAYGPYAFADNDLLITDPDLAEKTRTLEKRRLQEFALGTFPVQHVECFAELGEAGCVIHKVVHHQGSDLVILATHGRGPIRRFLLGSVAAKVLHDISAPILTGSGSALTNPAPQIPYRSVVCALDESDEAEGVMKAAAALAQEYQAQLALVHVVQTLPAALETEYGRYKKDLRNAADFKLRELKGRLGVNAPHTVVEATVADGVREEAIRRKADLIITGRGGVQGTFSRLWSHVYPIVREAPCPVLSI